MDEYINELENEAKTLLAERFGRTPTSDESPILELVTSLLEDVAGGVKEIPNLPVTTDEWLHWNRLLLESPGLLQTTASATLSEEKFPLPKTDSALQDWAAWVLVSTLERI